MSESEKLQELVAITEERKSMLDLMRRRLTINHSLVLHRDKASAADFKAMIEHLENAGMPITATLQVDGGTTHTRMYATWATDTTEKSE